MNIRERALYTLSDPGIMSMTDRELQRKLIIHGARAIILSAKDSGHNFGSIAALRECIMVIMSWTDKNLADRTISNMERSGIIRISKSGKGFALTDMVN